jgi:uncharacterized protein YuzE
MRVTYDPEADAVYIYLCDHISAGDVAFTYPCDPREVDGMINLDFDGNGVLLGVEIMDASAKLSPQLLTKAERP